MMTFIQKILVVCLLFLNLSNIQSQNKDLLNAFSKSIEYESLKAYAQAIQEIDKIYNPKSYEINYRLGWLYALNANTQYAIKYYEIADKLMPASVEVKWKLITIYNSLKDWNKVERLYQQILERDPKNGNANYYLGMIYYYRKDYVKAKKFFDISLNQYPFNYNYMLISAWNNYYLGNLNHATVLFNKVLLISSNDYSALEGLALIK